MVDGRPTAAPCRDNGAVSTAVQLLGSKLSIEMGTQRRTRLAGEREVDEEMKQKGDVVNNIPMSLTDLCHFLRFGDERKLERIFIGASWSAAPEMHRLSLLSV